MKLLFKLTFMLVMASCFATLAWAGEAVPASAQDLIGPLQKGGYVIYIRHSTTDHSQTDKDRRDFSDCSTQRNLSDQGRSLAKEIGAAFKRLGIPVGEVYSSPYCRCKDTAQLAFGKFKVMHDLRFAISTGREEGNMLARVLRGLLSNTPAKGFNTVIVSHTANLKDATGVWPKPEGATAVFQPQGDGEFSYMGMIMPEQWPDLHTADGM